MEGWDRSLLGDAASDDLRLGTFDIGTKQWAKLQQQFEEGVHTDVVIRIRVAPSNEEQEEQQSPAAKRSRISNAAAAADVYTDIKAHSVVLSASSAYFEKALTGEWAEASARRVELEVEDEQAVADLRLLIKLSYSESYTHAAGRLLPLDTRLRLAVRADALDFVEALEQLVASLPVGLDLAAAAELCLENLPPAVELHPGMGTVRSELMALLLEGIEEREGKEGEEREEEAAVVEAAVAALAKLLGPVEGMFDKENGIGSDSIPFRDHMYELPLSVFKRLLTSEALQLQSENETFELLVEWVRGTTLEREKRNELFAELAPLLRYHHMDPGFVAISVAELDYLGAPLREQIMFSALSRHDAVPSDVLTRAGASLGHSNRGVPRSEACWELETTFRRDDVVDMCPEDCVSFRWGLVAGLSMCWGGEWMEGEDDGGTFGLRFDFDRVGWMRDGFANGPTARMGFDIEITTPASVKRGTFFFWKEQPFYRFENVFEKPWAEVVREGSPFFPGGQMLVKVKFKLLTK